MIKTAELLADVSLDAIEVVHKRLQEAVIQDMTPLQLYVWIYRTEALLAVLKGKLMQGANDTFATLTDAQPTAKSWPIEGFAKLTRQSPPSSWTFPADLVKQEAELQALKESAKVAGTATKATGTINPATNVTFKIHLAKC